MVKKLLLGALLSLGCLICVAEFFLAFLLATLAVSAISFFLLLNGINTHSWTKCPLPLPDSRYEAVFMQRGAHAFLAEYNYRLRLKYPAGQEEILLPFNSGGRTFIEVFLAPKDSNGGPWLSFLDDKGGASVVDLGGKKSYRLFCLPEQGGKVILREIFSEYDSGLVNEPEIDISSWPLNKEPGLFLGRLNGRDHPLRFEAATSGDTGSFKAR